MINNNWVFGKNCGLNFSTDPPTPISNSLITSAEGCASISDSNGILLFYTDGVTIWDNTNTIQPIPLLGGTSSTQSVIIVPDPGNDKKYYVFTTGDGIYSSQEHFNGVSININTWAYSPLSSLMTLPNTVGYTATEKLIAIQHQNCKDFWVITLLHQEETFQRKGDGILRVFLVNSLGVQHISDTKLNQKTNDVGYMKASPDGLKLAIVSINIYKILVYPFNKSSGAVNLGGLMNINTYTGDNYGLEFSPNSSLLYFSDSLSGRIYQVVLSGTLMPTVIGNIVNPGALLLGRDYRIYIAKLGQNSLAAILNPNIIGTGCNISNSFISLPSGSQCYQGLPNLLPNACEDDCNCGCAGCNKDSEKQNEELLKRAKLKYHTDKPINSSCGEPFSEKPCKQSIKNPKIDIEPCFYFHWGDGHNDQIEEHDTEVFFLTVCNNYRDAIFNGLRITKINLIPIVDIEKIQIVPDVFISIDCLEPCTCQTREFAMINRANDTAGNYTLEVEYCYEEIVIAKSGSSGIAKFLVTISED